MADAKQRVAWAAFVWLAGTAAVSAQDNPAAADAAGKAPVEATAPAAADAGQAPPVPTGRIYRTVDPQGKVNFTDTPPADKAAEEVKMPTTNSMPATAPGGIRDGDGQLIKQEPVAAVKYTRLEITAPANDTVLGQDVDTVSMTVVVEPAVQAGHTVKIYYDGKFVSDGTGYTVSGLERGTHTFEAKIVDEKGRELKTSNKVQFHVRRISVNKLTAAPTGSPPKPGWFSALLGRGTAPAGSDEASRGGFASGSGANSSGGAGGMRGAGSVHGAPGLGESSLPR